MVLGLSLCIVTARADGVSIQSTASGTILFLHWSSEVRLEIVAAKNLGLHTCRIAVLTLARRKDERGGFLGIKMKKY